MTKPLEPMKAPEEATGKIMTHPVVMARPISEPSPEQPLPDEKTAKPIATRPLDDRSDTNDAADENSPSPPAPTEPVHAEQPPEGPVDAPEPSEPEAPPSPEVDESVKGINEGEIDDLLSDLEDL